MVRCLDGYRPKYLDGYSNRRLTAGVVAIIAVACSLLGAPRALAAAVGSRAPTGSLRLVLPLSARRAALERFAASVTDPRSPDYARYRSIAWLAAHFGAGTGAERRVVRYLRAHGATQVRVDATGLFVDATMPAGAAQRAFSTSLARFRGDRAGTFTAPASPVVIPAALRGLVTGVVGLDTRPIATAPQIARSTVAIESARLFGPAANAVSGYEPVSGTPSGCQGALKAGGFTPSQYLTAYAYGQLQGIKALGQGERVALIEIDGFRQSDVATFAHCFNLHLPPIVPFGVGVRHPLAPGGEATLDLEVLDAAAPALRSINVYESNAQASDVLQALTSPLQNPGYKPQVISASLGLCESQTIAAVGASGIANTESALQMAAASGISFLAASGDDGSADCVASSSSSALPEPQLAVNYPASSPWVTGVGGTNLTLTAQNAIESQTVWNDGNALEQNGGGIGAGGGGLSTLFKRPSYQAGVVAANHRAVPDIALLADVSPGYDVYCSAVPDCVNPSQPSSWQTVGGTSAATPLAAGGFALIDELLRLRQQQDLGLANPLLYKIGQDSALAAQVLQPVTTGTNDVGAFIQQDGSPLGCCDAGPGYNEAAGWGGINFYGLANAALAAQPPIADVSLSLAANQQPIAAGHILATVGCTGACDLSASAQVTIAGSPPFTDHADVYHIARAGSRTIAITPSIGQLSRLRAALGNGTRISASITGAIVDAGGNVERQTPPQQLAITG